MAPSRRWARPNTRRAGKRTRERDTDFKDAVDLISKVIDGVGVVAIVAGLVIATGAFALAERDREQREQSCA